MSTDPRAQQVGEVERRSVSGNIEIRAGSGSSIGVIRGLGVVFNAPTDIGQFVEVILPAAVEGVLDGDIISAVGHNSDLLIGRTSAGTMQVSVGRDGVHYQVHLSDTSAGRDVRENVRAGNLRGSSFSFSVDAGGERWDRGPGGKPRRTITKFAAIYDISPVARPAYPQTSISSRCLERVAELAGAEVRFVPSSISTSIDRDRAAPWSAPALLDLTSKSWSELSDAERKRIAGYFAYSANWPPERFSDLSLPHHDPATGKVIWRGLVAAAARLDQAHIPASEVGGVRAHLAKHFAAFGATAPWERSAGSGGSREETRRLKRQVEADIAAAEQEVRALDRRIFAEVDEANERAIRVLDARISAGRSGPGVTGRERWRAAYHEAGHAVATLLSNGTIVEVTLAACHWEFPRGQEPRGCLLSLSGIAAENVFSGDRGCLPGEGTSDYRHAAARLREMGLAPVDSWIARETAYAESLMTFYRSAVEALAEALYRRGRVSGADAEAILSRSISAETQRRAFSGESPRWGPLLPPSVRAVK